MPFFKKTFMLFFGIILYSIGITLTIQANIGLAPWDAFHDGIGLLLNMTIGQATILVGVIVVFLNFLLGENIGWGTIANGIFIGVFIDILIRYSLIPVGEQIVVQYLMATIGMFIIGFASATYIRVGLGAGPRDSLMIALTKKLPIPVKYIRSGIEIGVLLIGILLGGSFGLGTIYMSIAIGYIIQFTFKLTKFDGKQIRHRYIIDDVKQVKAMMKNF